MLNCFASEKDMSRLKAVRYRDDVDSRELAIYTPADAAGFLGIPMATLARWIYGYRGFSPLIEPTDSVNRLLSFYNLAEAHVLAATRYKHHVSFKSIRRAIETIREKYPDPHPLISQDFFTDGRDLFRKTIEENENLSTPGQANFKPIMDMFLRHIERDENNLVNKVFPIIKGQPEDKVIVVIHGIASGQPVISGYGVPVFIIHGRHVAGETNKSIAKDFGMPESKVQRAIEYVEKRAA